MRRASTWTLVVLFCLISVRAGSTPRRKAFSRKQYNFLKAEAQLAARAVRDARRNAVRLRTASQAARMQVISAKQQAANAARRARSATEKAIRAEKRLEKALPKLKVANRKVQRAMKLLERRKEHVRKIELKTQRMARGSGRTASALNKAAKDTSFHTRQTLMELRLAKGQMLRLLKAATGLHRLAKATRAANHKARIATKAAQQAQRLLWDKREKAAILGARAAVAVQQVRLAQLRMRAAKKRARVFKSSR